MKIGLTQRILYHKGRAYDSLEHGWYSYLKGHTLFPIPNRIDQEFELVATNLDALIITGGDDSTIRRITEIKMAAAFMERKKPVLGICHGAFLLTDILGGEMSDIEDHTDTEHIINYFGDTIVVNSYHNVGIKRLHATATPLCTDEWGNVEAFIDGTLAGIVWHPERMNTPWVPDEIQDLIFK